MLTNPVQQFRNATAGRVGRHAYDLGLRIRSSADLDRFAIWQAGAGSATLNVEMSSRVGEMTRRPTLVDQLTAAARRPSHLRTSFVEESPTTVASEYIEARHLSERRRHPLTDPCPTLTAAAAARCAR